MKIKKQAFEHWSIDDSSDIYGVPNWGCDYFAINSNGELEILATPGNLDSGVPLLDVVNGIKDRGMDMPVLLRVSNILDARIKLLHTSFRKAIKQTQYQGVYKGVFPIKVNQQQQIIEEICRFGEEYHHGLEAGSKAELIAALGTLQDREACLVCNGYKDEEFIDLALYACRLGYQCFLVVEMPSEMNLIIERSRALNIKPLIGIRMKLSTRASGQWTESGGDRSVFGLNTSELIDMVDLLRKEDMLDCLRLLHYHIGSQIPNIRDIRAGVLEACRVYVGLVEEGAAMGFLDLGGGLAVDYDGSHTNYHHSRNYTIDEYCVDIVETVAETLNSKGIAHPTIITESGRATIAYSSILLFNILDVTRFEPSSIPDAVPEDSNEMTKDLMNILKTMNAKNLQENFHDAIYYRDELRILFKNGRISLRERGLAESIFWHIMVSLNKEVKRLKYIPDEFEGLDKALADIYYGNLSIFQSLPDSWAIKQIFPIMPIHRLNERPSRNAIISDITCDCDGKIEQFVDLHDERHTLPLHELRENEEYYLAVFLVGAYQETLGDLHNLLGDTNVVSINLTSDRHYEIVQELEGDSVADVLSYVEYNPAALRDSFKQRAELAVRENLITPTERRAIMTAFENGINGYTYFER
ncbi:MAG TPA: biosynthetic arginine decarboxylase [Lentisphaeria bacterium]|nr:biosynthetic arginine decarboxylase [Lentisphaerota bacterium]OQC15129.1 MAG: Biosynthetic arginine decarboxylase [Lentisphaerae bacterium ADurb.Bin082]HQC52817.1 biosynthetic arginine decarboxylase [Lentisphaeria bacterium]HQL87850.1 biosynthetic arginine decarboxylase [Lentisphaeria bacterium]